MHIIFLDIDNVLNCASYRRAKLQSGDFSVNIETHCIAQLAKIVRATDAKIVLISSWRKFWMKGGSVDSAGQRIDEELGKFGLTVWDKTPVIRDGTRSQEVEQWLANNYVDRFVILDDTDFGWSKKLRPNWIQCPDETGLTDQLAERAVSILSTPESAQSKCGGLMSKLWNWKNSLLRRGKGKR